MTDTHPTRITLVTELAWKVGLAQSLTLCNYVIFKDIIKIDIHSVSKTFSSWNCMVGLPQSLTLCNYVIFKDIIKTDIHSVSKMSSSWNCMGLKKSHHGPSNARRCISVKLRWGHTFCDPVRLKQANIVENVPRTVNVTNKGRKVKEDVWEYLNKGCEVARGNCTVLSSTVWNMYYVKPTTLCGGM